jgi:hypothetical protein
MVNDTFHSIKTDLQYSDRMLLRLLMGLCELAKGGRTDMPVNGGSGRADGRPQPLSKPLPGKTKYGGEIGCWTGTMEIARPWAIEGDVSRRAHVVMDMIRKKGLPDRRLS